MKINEVEQVIGITKKNIRFYEQEGLLNPSRNTNGYRDYTEEDIRILEQIKLLRRLDIPIEEIRKLQSGSLTLTDCLERHLVTLKRKASNLDATIDFCKNISNRQLNYTELSAKELLLEMDQMEQKGAKFINIREKDKQSQKRGALIGASTVILSLLLTAALTIWLFVTQETIPTGSMIALCVVGIGLPIFVLITILMVLKERFEEIEGGELDEASKY